MPSLRRSLTLRLTLLFGVASTLVLLLIGVALYIALDTHFLHEDAAELRGKTELLASLAEQVRNDADLSALPGKLHDALVGHHALILEVQAPDGRSLFSNADRNFMAGLPAPGARAGRDVDGLNIESYRQGARQFKLVRLRLPTALPGSAPLNGFLAMNIDDHTMFMIRLRDSMFVFVIAGTLIAALLGWLAARIGIAPLRALSALTSRTSASRLHDRLDVEVLPPELEQLGRSFNAMLARLEDSVVRLQDFSSDLAHELRTPVSALMTQAQVALSQTRSASDYREVIYSALEEYDRLARTITDMLFLAKADHGLLIPAQQSVDLRAEVLALFDFYDALVESNRIGLAVTGSGSIRGDRLMMRRALSNLLSNAVRHAAASTTVSVDIGRSQDKVSISVVNEGPSISEEHLQRIFDRFYRVDPARERSSEGAGLGLAITKSIVAAHGGSITATSRGGITRFEIALPAESDPRTVSVVNSRRADIAQPSYSRD